MSEEEEIDEGRQERKEDDQDFKAHLGRAVGRVHNKQMR